MTADSVDSLAKGDGDYVDTEAKFDEVRTVAAFARFRLRSVLVREAPFSEPAESTKLTPDHVERFLDSEEHGSLLSSLGPRGRRQEIKNRLLKIIDGEPQGTFSYTRKLKDAQDPTQIVDHLHIFSRTVESPLVFCQIATASSMRRNDVQYFYFRSICEHYGLIYGDSLGEAFYRLGNRLNELSNGEHSRAPAREHQSGIRFSDLQSFLASVAKPRIVNAFLECCFSTHLIEVLYSKNLKETFVRKRGTADSEYLFGNVFSVPTASTGLNQLFGGNGPVMTIGKKIERSIGMPGRVLLASGRFGTGKSVLALLLASEVARKGGVAWYFSTEQSVAEVLFTLRTITGEPSDGVRIITDTARAIQFVDRVRGPHEGVLIVLNMSNVTEDVLWSGLNLAAELGKDKLDPSSLRLAVIDSLNAIPITPIKEETVKSTAEIKPDAEAEVSVRQSLFSGLARCTDSGMNLLLLEEQSGSPSHSDYSDVRNLADCVINLTVDSPAEISSHGYARRNIEILKSRFQRDQRGRHIFSIVPPNGFRVVPGLPAVKARVGIRRLETGRRPGKFGLPELDRILQVDQPAAGEVNVVRGDPGTFKTAISAAFLNEVRKEDENWAVPRPDGRRCSTGLFVSMRLGTRGFAKTLATVTDVDSKEPPPHLRVCQLPSAFVTPGEILRLIEEELRLAKQEGRVVRRVVLDDIGAWPSFSPFVKDDSSFGPTLLDFFARQPLLLMVTINSTVNPGEHHLHDFIVENATRLIQLERLVHGGRQRALLRVIETPTMNHMRDAFELRLDVRNKLSIDTRPSLFEVSEDNKHSVTGIQLYLQSESMQQRRYNERIENQLKSTLTPDVHLHVPDSISGIGDFTALGLTAINKLQIIQVDGYRLRRPSGDVALPRLYDLNSFGIFGDPLSNDFFVEYLQRLRCRTTDDQDHVIAVPYYDNLSFLVGNCERLDDDLNIEEITWEQIADVLSSKPSGPTEHPFFDFPQSSDENLNCLFFEVLFSKLQEPGSSFAGRFENFDHLRDTLLGPVGMSAAYLLHRIAFPSFAFHTFFDRKLGASNSDSQSQPARPEQFYVSSNAAIWRHWYTTYNQMMVYGGVGDRGEFKPVIHSEKSPIKLRALPGALTTAGEWYLCIPEHSAVPGAGLSIIELLQNESADRERYDLGVGLPVRAAAYEGILDGDNYPICPSVPQLTLDFFHALQRDPKIRRDHLPSYCTLSPFLANWLRRLLYTTDYQQGSDSEKTLNKVLKRMLKRTEEIVSKASSPPKH